MEARSVKIEEKQFCANLDLGSHKVLGLSLFVGFCAIYYLLMSLGALREVD